MSPEPTTGATPGPAVGRRPLPTAGEEAETLLGALDRTRAIFAWKTSDLSTEKVHVTLSPSMTTLAGLVTHLAFVGQQVRCSDRTELPSLRRTLVDLTDEHARHTGRADLIRESIDGLTGEDPPA